MAYTSRQRYKRWIYDSCQQTRQKKQKTIRYLHLFQKSVKRMNKMMVYHLMSTIHGRRTQSRGGGQPWHHPHLPPHSCTFIRMLSMVSGSLLWPETSYLPYKKVKQVGDGSSAPPPPDPTLLPLLGPGLQMPAIRYSRMKLCPIKILKNKRKLSTHSKHCAHFPDRVQPGDHRKHEANLQMQY